MLENLLKFTTDSDKKKYEGSFSADFHIDHLVGKLKQISRQHRSLIKKAYLLAEDAHKFQKRLSGEPYIIHPLSVAYILSDYNLDYETICAALLHDVIEDTSVTRDYIQNEFGEKVAKLVEGVTKISVIKHQTAENKQVINIRKMIMATTEDIRVILIKLADKLHNMRTLQYQPGEKAKRISNEVIDIYAPIAGRLGMYKIKWELEDLSLYHLDQEFYQQIKSWVAEKKNIREERNSLITSVLREQLEKHKIQTRIEARTKHFYSIYKKMVEQKKPFRDIYDLTGVRVMVKSVQDCYAVLGMVHTLWTPVPGRFKDYISVPKTNGYRSLHTTVVGPSGKVMEIQIRTEEMHLISEFGIAAHWSYKEKLNGKDFDLEKQIKIFQSASYFKGETAENEDPDLFLDELRANLESEDIYVFTPKGEIIALAKGATVLDFAFRIHTDLGLRCAGAKIEDRLVSIRTPLKSGDQVYVTISPHVKPVPDWLKIVRTSHAKAKIKAYFRKHEISFGGSSVTVVDKEKDKIEKPALPSPKNKEGQIRKSTEPKEEQNIKPVLKSGGYVKLKNEDTKLSNIIEWEGETDFDAVLAQCCGPSPGDKIRGFITKNRGISVHKAKCSSLLTLLESKENRNRVVNIHWKGLTEASLAKIIIRATDRPQLYVDLVKKLANSGVNICEARAISVTEMEVEDSFTIEVDSNFHLQNVTNELKKVEGVLRVEAKIRKTKPKAEL